MPKKHVLVFPLPNQTSTVSIGLDHKEVHNSGYETDYAWLEQLQNSKKNHDFGGPVGSKLNTNGGFSKIDFL